MTTKLSPEVQDALTTVITGIVNEAVDNAIAAKITNQKKPSAIVNDNRPSTGFKLPKAD